jgi:hypothetical protein
MISIICIDHCTVTLFPHKKSSDKHDTKRVYAYALGHDKYLNNEAADEGRANFI